MENKLYTFILFALFSWCLSASAQDTTHCNPNFGVYSLGSQANFAAIDTQAHVQHYWNFGDSTHAGFNSNLALTYHNYSHSGMFTVTHIIRDSLGGGCFDSTSQSVTITIAPPCQVYFTAQRDTLDHHRYNFFASYPISGGIHDSITWFVNDSLVGTGPSLLNYYFSGGAYTICVKLTTTGCQAEQCQQILVGTTDSCGINPSFGYVADSSLPQRIRFIPLPDSSSYSYLWDFGDGTFSTVRHAVHDYAYGGYFTVSLSVTKHNGLDSCMSHTSGTVYVAGRDTCTISFTYTKNPSNPYQITFNAQDSTGLDSLTWRIINIADSLHSVFLSGHNPTYVFPDSGCYLVQVSAITPGGCQSSSQQMICTDTLPSNAISFISSYPNPAASQANLNVNLGSDNTIHITVFNSMGNQVLTTVVAGNKGQNHVALPISNLPTGIYYIQIQYGNEIKRSKIQKL
jgi:PKD repeat protein